MRPSVLAPLWLLASCAAPSFDLQARYGQPDISGAAGVSSGGVGGAADLEQAGLEEDSALGARVDLDFGAPHLVALYQGPSFTGSGTLDVTISDGANTITTGTAVDTEIGLDQFDAALVFDLVPGDTVEVGLGFGVAYLDALMRFVDPGTGTVVSSEEAFPVPLLAATASVCFGALQLAAFAGGIDYEYEDDSVTFLDADLYGRWKLLGGDGRLRGSLVLGYRLTDLDIEYDDAATTVTSDLRIGGPYFGLEFTL